MGHSGGGSGGYLEHTLKYAARYGVYLCLSCFSLTCTDKGELLGHSGGGSGGYLEHTLKYAAKQIYGIEVEQLQFKTLRFSQLI